MAPPITQSAPLYRPGRHRDAFAYLLILPTCLAVLLVHVYPIGAALAMSFQGRVQGRPVDPFVGLANYRAVLSDAAFWRSLWTTVRWTLGSVAGQLVLGTALAVLVHGLRRGRRVVTSLLLLPWVTPLVVAALTCRWLLHADFGVINALGIPRCLGLAAHHDWLGDEKTVLVSVVLAHIWRYYGFVMLIVLARLQTIPEALIEAAQIDGGGRWSVFCHVTLPQIRDVLSITVLLMCIWTFNTFDQVFLMTGGRRGADLLAIEVWRRFFGAWNFGLAAATAALMFVVMLVLTAAYARRCRL